MRRILRAAESCLNHCKAALEKEYHKSTYHYPYVICSKIRFVCNTSNISNCLIACRSHVRTARRISHAYRAHILLQQQKQNCKRSNQSDNTPCLDVFLHNFLLHTFLFLSFSSQKRIKKRCLRFLPQTSLFTTHYKHRHTKCNSFFWAQI